MKTNKILTIAIGLVAMLFVNSCVEDDDYTIPEVLVPAVDFEALGTRTTFASVIARYEDAILDGEEIGTWEFDAPLYIEGYVISSDAAGNFFEEIIIQNTTDGNDLVDDPRRGLKVEINVRDIGNFYNYGRKVYVKLNGLAIGISNGVYTLGRLEGNSLEQIDFFEYQDFVIRDPEVFTISPKMVAISDLTEQDENTLVQLSDVQFIRNQLGLTYAGEVSDEFDGFRTLESCETGATITLQTSTFADFKSLPVDSGRGSITGIYSRDFRDDFDVFIINSTDDINFNSGDRCDPVTLECDGPTSEMMVVWEEDFESISDESELDGIWYNENVSGGSERYELNSFSGDQYMKISAFGTNESPMEAWLVTPAINLDSSNEEELSFNISANFETGTVLTALISTEYTGDPLTTEWIELDANIPVGDGGFGDFVESTLNISCLNGDVHVAFKYLGAANGAETRYHITNVKVTGSM